MSLPNASTKGTIYGVGLGPGDQDLLSVRADRLVRQAEIIAFFCFIGRSGQARQIVNGMLADKVQEIPMEYPVTTEISISDPLYNKLLSQFYTDCTARLQAIADRGKDVVVLCEGDPFFYGSFMHLYERLKHNNTIKIVPAITGMSGAWTATAAPITWGDDVLTVLMGTLSEDVLIKNIANADAIVIMKIGRNINKVRNALIAAGRFEKAWLIEYATMPNQSVQLLSEANLEVTPYFSIIVVHGKGRRP